MTRLEKIEEEARKARERIAAAQAVLKEIEGKRTEQENLQIVAQIRALKLTREELYAFLGGGALPAPLAGIFAGGADEYAPEPRRARRKGRRDAETPDGADIENPHDEITDFESEEQGETDYEEETHDDEE
jgi:hypothetical protein